MTASEGQSEVAGTAPFDGIACPRCKAEPGSPCAVDGRPVPLPHAARGLKYVRLADEELAAVRTHDDAHDD